MRWQNAFTKMLFFAGVPLCIGLLIVLAVQSSSNGIIRHTLQRIDNEDSRTRAEIKTSMLDPQGDADLASLINPSAAPSTTVQIILSRKLLGYQLPCL